MREYGINVPPGIAVTSLDALDSAVSKLKDSQNEVPANHLEQWTFMKGISYIRWC